MPVERAERLSEAAFAARTLVIVALVIAVAQLFSRDAVSADSAGVTDLTMATPDAIESVDIVSALAPSRGTRIEAGAPPTVRLPILFEFNSANLQNEGEQLLEKLGVALNTTELEGFRFSVEGHTDSVGSDSYNDQLSERRASAVRQYLQENGVADDRLEANGMGEANPVAANETSEGRQRNRRVEIINLGSDS